jgi:hypothetical protein
MINRSGQQMTNFVGHGVSQKDMRADHAYVFRGSVHHPPVKDSRVVTPTDSR